MFVGHKLWKTRRNYTLPLGLILKLGNKWDDLKELVVGKEPAEVLHQEF